MTTNLTADQIQNKIKVSHSLNTATTGFLVLVPALLYWAHTTFALLWPFYVALLFTLFTFCLSIYFHGRGVALVINGNHGNAFNYQAAALLVGVLVLVGTVGFIAIYGTTRVDNTFNTLLEINAKISKLELQLSQQRSALDALKKQINSLEQKITESADRNEAKAK